VITSAALVLKATFALGFTADQTMIHSPETSNKMIQKGLAFWCERSGTVTVPGANSPF
jgi:hypothetical protein